MPKCPSCDHSVLDGVENCPDCGAQLEKPIVPKTVPASSEQLDDALVAELTKLMKSGLIINAVKRYREATGASLVEAKQAVEQLRDRSTLSTPRATADSKPNAIYEKAVLDLLRDNKPMDAIRLYRQQHGTDLKTSKEAIEQLARQHAIELKLPGFGSFVVLLAFLVVAVGAVVAAIVYFQVAS